MQNHQGTPVSPVQTINEQTITKIVKVIKSFFKGKPVSRVTHTHYYHKPVTIRMADLSPQERQSFDQLFDKVFSNVQFSK